MPIAVIAAALLGLAVGSFLNVVIHRVPTGASLVRPGSHCPHCDSAVRARHNVPVVGWLVLHGRCADCATPISPRYPIVEFGTAVLFVAITVRFAHADAAGDYAALPAYLFFAAIGVALAVIDLDALRLPNAIVHPSYLVLGALLGAAALAGGGWPAAARAGVGAVALFGGYLALAPAHPGGMGLGDVKLAGLVGGVLGYLSWSTLLVGTFAAFLLGGVTAGALVALRGAGRKTAIPFGPAMIAGAFLAILLAPPLAHSYLSLVHQA